VARRYGGDRRAEREARLERHAAETNPDTVMNAAARFLEMRSRSVYEVRRHLTSAHYPSELVERAVERLTELGMLDDRAFARAWVESRDRARPRGEQALRRELALKGIDREIVAEVLLVRQIAARDAEPDGDRLLAEGSADSRAAERLLAKRGASLGRIPELRERRQRAYALLARSGFAPDVCRDVAARFVAAMDAESEDDGEE
jgi:regulatory protein